MRHPGRLAPNAGDHHDSTATLTAEGTAEGIGTARRMRTRRAAGLQACLRGAVLAVALAGLPVSAAQASAPDTTQDPALGLWKTEPDRKDLVSHIEIRSCGAALCGRILAAFDPDGNPVHTPNIGKRLFWDLVPQGGGAYSGGTVYVPLLNMEASATAELSGDRLKVTGCKGFICDGQTWTRVRR